MQSLLTDLFRAYYAARRNKRRTPSQLRFEMNLERNLINLYHDLQTRTYRPSPSICFIIEDPVKREVFASEFRDRVVHHLYYNYVSPLFERTFIHDSYSCRKGKGTLFGIERLEHHIRSVSRNYTRPAYILKLDIQGYFMSINRQRLNALVRSELQRLGMRDAFVYWLTDVITLKNPLTGCRRCGQLTDWADLPDNKSLFKQADGVGLPIGDLTSQLFSNVYLNRLDWFVTQELGFRHYGRYVDDFYIADEDKQRLWQAIEPIHLFLQSMGMTLHPRKVRLLPISEPVPFLGAKCRPYYRHASVRTVRNWRMHLAQWSQLSALFDTGQLEYILTSAISYIGYFSHFKAAKVIFYTSSSINNNLSSILDT